MKRGVFGGLRGLRGRLAVSSAGTFGAVKESVPEISVALVSLASATIAAERGNGITLSLLGVGSMESMKQPPAGSDSWPSASCAWASGFADTASAVCADDGVGTVLRCERLRLPLFFATVALPHFNRTTSGMVANGYQAAVTMPRRTSPCLTEIVVTFAPRTPVGVHVYGVRLPMLPLAQWHKWLHE